MWEWNDGNEGLFCGKLRRLWKLFMMKSYYNRKKDLNVYTEQVSNDVKI